MIEKHGVNSNSLFVLEIWNLKFKNIYIGSPFWYKQYVHHINNDMCYISVAFKLLHWTLIMGDMLLMNMHSIHDDELKLSPSVNSSWHGEHNRIPNCNPLRRNLLTERRIQPAAHGNPSYFCHVSALVQRLFIIKGNIPVFIMLLWYINIAWCEQIFACNGNMKFKKKIKDLLCWHHAPCNN